MSNEVINTHQQFLDDDGHPLSNGTITFYVNEDTTLASIWSNDALTTAQSNPYTLSSSGCITGDVKYPGLRTLLIKNADGAHVRTLDNVGTMGAIGDGIVPFATVTAAQASISLQSGMTICLADRASSLWDVSSSGTANGYNVLALAGGLYATLRDGLAVSVVACGAVGDGVTDDTDAIQAALDIGGLIHFEPETYMADDLTAALTIFISGYGATLKRRSGQLSSTYILDIQGDGSVVKGLNFDGNAANNSGHTGRHEGLRISADNVTVEDSDGSNTPSGGTQSANCFYVSGDNATMENVSSSNAGYGAIRIDGDGAIIHKVRITDFTEKGIVFNGTIGTSASSLMVSDAVITSSSTNVNAQVCILIDSGSSSTEQLNSVTLSNIHCELTGNVTGSNVVKIVNTKHCTIDGFNFIQSGTNHASFRAQEFVEFLTLTNGRMDYDFNLDSFDYKRVTLRNVSVGKEDKSFTSSSPISGLYARELITLDNVSVYGATSGSVRLENWVGQSDTDSVALTEPNLTISGFLQNASTSTVPVLYLAMSSSDITPGRIVVGDVTVITGYTSYGATLTGSTSTERLIQRNPGSTFSRDFLSASVPAANTWKLGDRVYNSLATSSGFTGWECTAGGSPGTWAAFGQIGTATSIAATPIFVGQNSVVAGEAYIAVGVSSSADWKKITP